MGWLPGSAVAKKRKTRESSDFPRKKSVENEPMEKNLMHSLGYNARTPKDSEAASGQKAGLDFLKHG